MKEKTVRKLETLKENLNCSTDIELARKLVLPPSMIYRWKAKGFPKSTEVFLDLLLESQSINRR